MGCTRGSALRAGAAHLGMKKIADQNKRCTVLRHGQGEKWDGRLVEEGSLERWWGEEFIYPATCSGLPFFKTPVTEKKGKRGQRGKKVETSLRDFYYERKAEGGNPFIR